MAYEKANAQRFANALDALIASQRDLSALECIGVLQLTICGLASGVLMLPDEGEG
jgi:hypothetical protein